MKHAPSPVSLKRIKAAAAFARLDWRAIAARPSTALDFVTRVEAAMPRCYQCGEHWPCAVSRHANAYRPEIVAQHRVNP